MTHSSLPLQGVLVVALEQAVAAPAASCRLADAGARVIKLERKEGDFARHYDSAASGQSAYFAWANRGKESLVVDIKDPSDNALVHRILSRADVFLQNLSAGAAQRAGLGSDSLRTNHPRLITCDISGYRRDGDFASMKAYDMLVQAESALISISSPPGQPGRIGISICDLATGVQAALSITEALLLRERTGRGSAIRMALFDVMADFMSVPLLQFEGEGTDPAHSGLSHPTITPYGGYKTLDGETIVIAIQNDREWARLAAGVLERPELAEDPGFLGNFNRLQRRSEVDRRVRDAFLKHTRAKLQAKLVEASIAFATVNSLQDLSGHPELRRWTISSETGSIDVPAHPDLERSLPEERRHLPMLNEHGEAIRAEFAED